MELLKRMLVVSLAAVMFVGSVYAAKKPALKNWDYVDGIFMNKTTQVIAKGANHDALLQQYNLQQNNQQITIPVISIDGAIPTNVVSTEVNNKKRKLGDTDIEQNLGANKEIKITVIEKVGKQNQNNRAVDFDVYVEPRVLANENVPVDEIVNLDSSDEDNVNQNNNNENNNVEIVNQNDNNNVVPVSTGTLLNTIAYSIGSTIFSATTLEIFYELLTYPMSFGVTGIMVTTSVGTMSLATYLAYKGYKTYTAINN